MRETEDTTVKTGNIKVKIGIVLALILIIAAAGAYTFNVDATLPATGMNYPYTTTYDVLFPDGEKIEVAGTTLIALTDGNEVFLKVADENRKMLVGETETITSRRVVAKIFGVSIIDTNYRIDAEYRGLVGDLLDFYLIVQTEKQVPQFIINMLMPEEINARPV